MSTTLAPRTFGTRVPLTRAKRNARELRRVLTRLQRLGKPVVARLDADQPLADFRDLERAKRDLAELERCVANAKEQILG